MPTFDQVEINGNMTLNGDMQVNGDVTVASDIQLNGNQTIFGDLQVNGSETIFGSLQVNGSQTIFLNFQVNGNQTVVGSLQVNQSINTLGSIQAAVRMLIANLPTLPASVPATQQVRYYNPGFPNQPGLVLKGTNGSNYVLFVDASGGTPHLAIQLA
ncbi:hypothetical protein H7B67_09360 [Cohnella thailandensis]|uniref:Polymer-forming cytoskeletal protein n=1 Tax=Cohnella thailandensis TaxID=557557 RepID=A0A841SXH5_9BACL|nr:hypothetical protein [Cohnella thailandensis]